MSSEVTVLNCAGNLRIGKSMVHTSLNMYIH